ncbi:MAG: protein-L-isoaspartate(D-aspartate) O-methyltransferase [Anaerolineales bacterium]|nr:protein-L-isoaspartate(D-aspartate) O-methyltransferase [Anaerolineales bacterium]
MNAPLSFEEQRQRMVEEQLIPRRSFRPLLLEAMRTVPRECFVPEEHQHLTYADGPLPIGEDQTISQPYIVALMTDLLELEASDKVLEIGTGSGYQAAVLAYLAAEVHSVERHASLAKAAQQALSACGVDNVHVHVDDGSKGWPQAAPYDGMIVTAAAPRVSDTLLGQLADGAFLVVPVGGYTGQSLQRWQRHGNEFIHDTIAPVAFVPLRGEEGWAADEWKR